MMSNSLSTNPHHRRKKKQRNKTKHHKSLEVQLHNVTPSVLCYPTASVAEVMGEKYGGAAICVWIFKHCEFKNTIKLNSFQP